MKIVNSYVFIPKEEKLKENAIRIREGIPYIFEKQFNIDSEQNLINEATNHSKRFYKDIKNMHSKIIRGSFEYSIDKSKKTIIEYKFMNADSVYYLDIAINDSKAYIIKVLNELNNIFLTNKAFTNHYIPIISYDYVSENYCNKLYPLLNTFERKFRKLLFLIFTSHFKVLYFEATASEEVIKKTKKIIKSNSNEYRIQNYFYSIDIGTLRRFLFDKNWTITEDKKRNELLKKDLSKMTNEELKSEINKIGPKSNWERFFQNKGFSDDIDLTMKSINDLRNLVAHNKIMNESDYKLLKNQLNSLTMEINKAIRITESIDFIIINNDKYTKMFSGIKESISKIFEELHYNDYLPKYIENLKDFAKELSLMQSPMFNALLKGINDSDKKN